MNTRLLTGIAGVLLVAAFANASTVDWKGLTWNTRGDSTTATVNASGHLEVFVVKGETSDPGVDNWSVWADLPAELTQANGPWVEFAFLDETAAANGGGPRAFIDTHENGTESMLQGGIYEGFSDYKVNHATYDGEWGGEGFFPNTPDRTTGEHAFLAGMRPDGTVDLYLDGTLYGVVPALPDFTFFQKAWLGVTTSEALTGTYTDFSWGTGYVPEPASILLVGLAGLMRRRR